MKIVCHVYWQSSTDTHLIYSLHRKVNIICVFHQNKKTAPSEYSAVLLFISRFLPPNA